MANDVSATEGLMKPRAASGRGAKSASRPAISRVGERMPSQATTRSASMVTRPSGPSATTPTTRPSGSRSSSTTVCSFMIGRSRSSASMSAPKRTATATGGWSGRGAIGRPARRTSS